MELGRDGGKEAKGVLAAIIGLFMVPTADHHVEPATVPELLCDISPRPTDSCESHSQSFHTTRIQRT